MTKGTPEDLDRKIGALVRARRYKVEMGQPELAEFLGVTVPAVQKYETGKTPLTLVKLVAIAHALKCSTLDLIPKGAR